MVKEKRFEYKRYHNQMKIRFIDERPETFEKPMNMLYNVFGVPVPQFVEPKRTSSRKKKTH